MSSLLHAYTNIFATPSGLPSQRRHDHRIHVLPGTAPVAVRLYRYAQLLKDEVERQCGDMLAQGMIRPSSSPLLHACIISEEGRQYVEVLCGLPGTK
jgi:hypothetical protein